ncbi:hypothetical protein RZR97_09945 [Hydrogenimonas thermophila]|uniref:hypothetical protein n=1 Tax=Hydrogenimonas thermophila TaxID=223786 RepID=UPI00293718D7|nr:hypothetical protein [Hydrogenimonas thermophila]WOE69424.1 hypothetical protein RZR91_09975 [Hydrogenimonas thermophila]WOE71933.1 hypothetical protein RZR97_09945 [Hydrogenimonas thermophila]
MIKKALTFSIIAFVPLIAGSIPMPPSMPSIALKNDIKGDKKKDKTNDSCKVIPPMLIHLPPMLENDLDKCKNSLYKPTKKVAESKLKKLLKKDVKVSKITSLEGFSMLYKIETNVGNFYCNRNVDKCLTSYIKVVE